MRGFGSPSVAPGTLTATSGDRGFGSPSTPPAPLTASEGDRGFGSPSIAVLPAVSFAGDDGYLPDEGGVFLTLKAAAWAHSGPYYCRIVAVDGTLYPLNDNAYSGVQGNRDRCYTDHTKETLRFVLPPAPPGLYSIRIRHGIGMVDEILLVNAIVIVRRNRAPNTYRIRNRLPPIYLTGARSMIDEVAL